MTTSAATHKRLDKIARERAKSRQQVRSTPADAIPPDLSRYLHDPVGFAADILHVTLTPDQADIIRGLPGRVKVRAGHNVGKTFVAAVAVVWWYYTRPKCVVITTAPTEKDVIDLLWTEIRLLVRRSGLPSHLQPAAPGMYDPADPEEHYAKGYTAAKGESFQGRHRPHMLFIFDEDEGVAATYWKTTNTMYKPGEGHGWLAIGNPTTTTSQSFAEESLTDLDGQPKWALHTLSSLAHPNIAAGLAGEPVPVPSAVTVDQVKSWVAEWCEAVPPGEQVETDIEWPPGSGAWFRPGPDFESRVIGRRPSAALCAVWSEALFDQAACWTIVPAHTDRPELGVDVARFGDDWTEMHGRVGPASTYHRAGQGWDTMTTCGRVIEAATELADRWNAEHPHSARIGWKDIKVKIDDSGVGGGVTDRLCEQGGNVIAVNAGTRPDDPLRYVLRRDQLWFALADRARAGLVSFARLDRRTRSRMRQQALAVMRGIDSAGRRTVETKKDMKKRTGRSPDTMDAVNLAYHEPSAYGVTVYDSEEQ